MAPRKKRTKTAAKAGAKTRRPLKRKEGVGLAVIVVVLIALVYFRSGGSSHKDHRTRKEVTQEREESQPSKSNDGVFSGYKKAIDAAKGVSKGDALSLSDRAQLDELIDGIAEKKDSK